MAKFVKGQKANPAGRPAGSSDWRTRIARSLEDDLPALLAKTRSMAMRGDIQAMRLLLERTLPPRKPVADPVVVDCFWEAKTLTAKAHAVLEAVGLGKLPPDVGAQVIAVIGSTASIAEIDDLKRRIEKLEGGKR